MLGTIIGLPEPTINIGFSSHLGPEFAHGRAWLHEPGTGLVAKPFLVDKPKLMQNVTLDIIDQLFEQIIKLGLDPHKLEFIDGGNHVMYQYGIRRPVYKQRKLAP